MIKRITLFLALALLAFAPFGRARADAFFIGTALQPARVGDRLGDNQVENTMCVMADSVQTIFDEAHETNSIPCGLIEFPLPDLVIGQLELLTPWPADPYSQVTFTVAVTNTSPISVSDPIFVDIFVNPTEVYTTHIPLNQSSGYNVLASFDAGETQVLTITAVLGFKDITAGQTICGMVDSLQQFDEADETNNTTCRLIEPPLPDLVIGQLELLTPLVANQPLTFTVWITNTGTVTASEPFSVALFINPSVVYTTHIPLDQSEASTALDSLDIGTSRLITLTMSLGLTDVPTTTLVYAMVDSGRTTAEMNETQNLTSRTFTISPQRIYLPIVVR